MGHVLACVAHFFMLYIGVGQGTGTNKEAQMEVTDGRGLNKKADAMLNKEYVRLWFEQNPGGTISECCRGLKLTYKTVRRHMNALIQEQEAKANGL